MRKRIRKTRRPATEGRRYTSTGKGRSRGGSSTGRRALARNAPWQRTSIAILAIPASLVKPACRRQAPRLALGLPLAPASEMRPETRPDAWEGYSRKRPGRRLSVQRRACPERSRRVYPATGGVKPPLQERPQEGPQGAILRYPYVGSNSGWDRHSCLAFQAPKLRGEEPAFPSSPESRSLAPRGGKGSRRQRQNTRALGEQDQGVH